LHSGSQVKKARKDKGQICDSGGEHGPEGGGTGKAAMAKKLVKIIVLVS